MDRFIFVRLFYQLTEIVQNIKNTPVEIVWPKQNKNGYKRKEFHLAEKLAPIQNGWIARNLHLNQVSKNEVLSFLFSFFVLPTEHFSFTVFVHILADFKCSCNKMATVSPEYQTCFQFCLQLLLNLNDYSYYLYKKAIKNKYKLD